MSELKMKDGFYPALGTPTDGSGRLIVKSFRNQIDSMIGSGASGILCLGSMGKMASVRNNEYSNITKQCVAAVKGRIPVMVGVMDCSADRVLDRIDALDNIVIDGVVATSPFYSVLNAVKIKNFFKLLSEKSGYPVYIYDLPSVTQSPITGDILNYLMKLPNIKGVKTANINLILDLHRNGLVRNDFSVFYSGLDSFDAAIFSGIKKNLDGMFTCTPYNSKMMYADIENNDHKKISYHLNNIITLRNIFLKESVMSAYSYSMGLLGCPGNYHPDYDMQISDNLKEEIYGFMKSIKEI